MEGAAVVLLILIEGVGHVCHGPGHGRGGLDTGPWMLLMDGSSAFDTITCIAAPLLLIPSHQRPRQRALDLVQS